MDTLIYTNPKGAILTISDRGTGFAIIELLECGKNPKEMSLSATYLTSILDRLRKP